MGVEISSGPYVISGNTNPQQNSEPDQGPSITFQGDAILDPRYVGTIGAALTSPMNKIFAHFNHAYACLMDVVPSALLTTKLVAAATRTVPVGGSLALSLQTAQSAGYVPAVRIVPSGSAATLANAVTVAGIDLGMTLASTTSGLRTVTLSAANQAKYFRVGQSIGIGGAGASANTVLYTTVTAISGTTLTVADAAGQTVSSTAPIFTVDPNGVGAWPWLVAGAGAMFNAYMGLSRNLTITSNNAGDTGYALNVVGYDIWNVPMRETISMTANGTASGKKAFKYITSLTLTKTGGGTTTGTVAVGVGDVIGFPLRNDQWEYMNIFFNGAFVSSNTGWTQALQEGTAPSATSADVRGTYALQSASDGTKVLTMFMTMPLYQVIAANNLNSQSLFGQAQF